MRCFIVALLLLGSASVQAADWTFEIYQDAKQEHRWRLKNGDGDVMATAGQGFASKKSCEQSVENFKNKAGTDPKVKFEVYKDNGGKSRWRLIASNGQTVASSPTGYKSDEECNKMVEMIKKEAKNAKVTGGK